MKLIGGLIAAWVLTAIVIGWLGDRWLLQQWQTEVQGLFARDVQLAISILHGQTWQTPAELDPQWQAIEQDFDLDIVPLPVRPAQPAPSTSTISGSVADSAGRLMETAPLPELIRSASGRWRVITQTTDSLPGLKPSLALQFTREVRPAAMRPWWWTWWCIVHGSGWLFACLALRASHLCRMRERSVLGPWLAAAKLPVTKEPLLPPLAKVESEIEPALSMVAERVNRHVAELRSFNQRSDLVLGNLQEGVLAVDQNSAVLLANSALRSLLEIHEDSVINRPLLEVVRIPLVTQLIDKVLRKQVPHEDVLEFGMPAKHLRLLARPLPLEEQRSGALLTVRDETLLKRIDLIRRDFVANASHELKTPLAAIRAYAETLQMGALDDRPAAEQFVNDIISQADRINGLVQGMLQLSRVQSGTALRIDSFDVQSTIASLLTAIDAMAKAKGVTLSVEQPSEKLTIYSDRAGFQTILSNLLSNAVRYTPEHGRVQLTLQHDDPWLIIAVSDTGIGIQSEDLERIFERFYRAEKGRSADTGGTGLGLAIVKNLVHALGGRVTATSEPNRGSRFEVRLPIRPT